MDEIVLNKAAAIERSVRRAREEYAGHPVNLREDYTKQDSIILNVQRATETAIDLAMHLVKRHKLGIPQDSRDAFTLLSQAGLLSVQLASALKKMVGFRNIAVHDYQALNLDIVERVVEVHLDEVLAFARWAIGSD